MNAKNKAFPLKHLIVMTATGEFDLNGSKLALQSIADEPSFNEQTEVLLDLRNINCLMSTTDIFELAQHMAFPNPALDTHRKIAVLVSGHLSFDHAQFFELCARNRGVNVQAFDEYKSADEWIYAELPPDPNQKVAARPRLPGTSQVKGSSHPQVGALLYGPHST